jgi:oligopeptide/dipeptide ABC transporter ATP-binding protein
MSTLDVSNLTVQLPAGGDRPQAVTGVSFAVEKEEILCLVGESGSGKTVIAQAIMGLLPKTLTVIEGEIRLEGEALRRASEARRRALRGARMAMIFQEPMAALNPVMSCGAQLDEVLRFHTANAVAERRRRIVELLGEVALPDPERILASYPHQLSGGQRQRVMIAMALALEPALLIADEPTTALDVTTQAQILDLLRHLQAREGMAIMLITHNLGVVAEMCDEVVVMYLGRVVERGPVDAIFHAPRHPYTRALLRSIPSIQARVRTKLPTIAGSIPHPHNRPSGCPFHSRCGDWIRGTCERYEPELLPVGDDEDVAVSCFLHHAPRAAAVPAGA